MINRIINWIEELKQARKKRLTEKLNERASTLSEGKEYDLVFLYDNGLVIPRAKGQSITNIYGEVENLTGHKIKVAINPGTYFEAKGNYQNMVSREKYSFILYPESTKSVSIDATCINAGRPIPGEKDKFVGVKKVSDDLIRFLNASGRSNSMTIQSGVWAITDGYSGYQIKNYLVYRDSYGNNRQAVTDSDIYEAKTILDNLGIHNNL